ncbi:MAG: TonB-dependent receptor [Candidatus Arcticimaribacter sp.]|nr:TonB-dependent receptor [Flavobacteriaceae bacterium]PSR09818.1 MAG: TonB-dependent receptor [Candidatus Arcticimaribacter sp.]PTM01624.1 MAG: TonB-dependent receptor [Candidatus Arcticimaribacter sp.]
MQNRLLLILLTISTYVLAQNTGTFSGQIIDEKTQYPLEGSSVILEGTNIGVITDANGYFTFENVPTKSYNIQATYLGYESQTLYNVIVKSVGTPSLLFKLNEASEALDEIILSKSSFRTSKETPLSTQSFSAVEIETYPGGNNDIAKVAQSLPGISPSIGGFRNDFIIRGGAPNESVYYLDGVEIPNINHFSTQGSAGGPVGMLNVAFIREVTLSSSAFGAEYDNPLSGVLAFEQREGNDQKYSGNVRIGASEAGATFNGPLFKGGKERSNTTLMISARRSYLQFVFALVGLPIRPDYWDYQWKLNHKIDERNSLTFIGLGSIDDFSVVAPDDFDVEQQAALETAPIIEQRTITLGLTWKHKFKNGTGQVNTTLSTNRLKNVFSQYQDNENKTGILFRNDSKEQETKLRVHTTQYIKDWKVSYGLNVQQSVYTNNTDDVVGGLDYETAIDFAKYGFFGKLSRSFVNNRLSLALGLRSDADSFTNGSTLIDNLSPRLSASYMLNESSSWKLNASVGRYFKIPTYTMLGFQNNSGEFINKSNRYTQSDHYVFGVEYNLSPSARFTVEAFRKDYSQYPVSVLDGVSLANKGAGFEVLGNEAVVDTGSGLSKGIEVLFQQKLSNNFYGILAYTLFSSEFSGIDNVRLPSVWDSGNLLTFTGGYKLPKNWEVSLRYRYAGATPFAPTDTAATLITYPQVIIDYSRLGENKLSTFKQGDFRLDKKWNFEKLSFNFYIEIQNFLAQENPRPDEYTLARTDEGVLILPKELVKIEREERNTPFPSFGFVFDF